MKRAEAIEWLEYHIAITDYNKDDDLLKAFQYAIEALQIIQKLKEIINIPNLVIQEDVLKYKMICEVIEKMDEVEE